MSDYIGKVISGAKIISQLGAGGGGLVFIASHPDYGEKVVLKILPQDQFPDNEMRERFKREMNIMQKLDHPNIVKVFKVGEENNCSYLLMQYIDATDLDTFVAIKGAVKEEKAIKLMLHTTRALKAAHDNNIIHRDIKPSNILVDVNLTNAYLCDFGLAKDLTQDTGLTQAGAILGTPNFMSPEQWFGTDDISNRSDIYSLGASFFYILTGSKPVQGDDATSVMANSLFNETPLVSSVFPGISPALDNIISKMMHRDIAKRYPKTDDVISALEKISGNKKGFFSKIFG